MARLDNPATLFLSMPQDIEFLGMRSDTRTMQHCGWSFVAQERHDTMEYGLMAKHQQTGLVARFDLVTQWEFAYGRAQRSVWDPIPSNPTFGERERNLWRCKWVSNERHVQVYEAVVPGEWKPVDMRPDIVHIPQPKPLWELSLFRAFTPETREIIVEPKDVQQCLDMIEKLQAPELAAIRQRNRAREQAGAATQVRAQIITLAA